MKKHWFISDTHFNHQKIIEYCNRPFTSVDQMNEVLVRNWNAVVSPDDTVWHLGDVCLGNRELLVDLVATLNGHKFLVKGNHDTRNSQFYRDVGFEEVYDHPIIIKDFIVLSHEPMPFVMNSMYFNVHGHVHDSPMFQNIGKGCACVCVERWNYAPVEDIKIFGAPIDGFGHRAPMSFAAADGTEVVHNG